jgi:hypothetical protein
LAVWLAACLAVGFFRCKMRGGVKLGWWLVGWTDPKEGGSEAEIREEIQSATVSVTVFT